MKRFFVIAAAVVASMLSFSSCQEKMENRVLSSPERQDRMDATLAEFLDATSSSEVGFIVDDYARFLESYMVPDYDLSAFGEFGKVIDFVVEDDIENRVSFANLSILLSNLDGEVEFGESAATFTPKEGSAKTVLSFELQGKPVVVTLEQVGKRSVIDFGEYYDDTYRTITDEGYSQNVDITEIRSVKLELPEQILVTVTKDGAAYASAKVVPSYSISEGGVDFTKDYAGADIEITLKDYQLIIDKTKLDLDAELATVNARLLKNGQELLGAHASLGIGLRRDDHEYSDGTFETEIMPVKANKLNLSLTLMQDVEFRFYCANLAQAIVILDGDSPYLHQEVPIERLEKAEWSRKVDAFNAITSINLYFTDNSAVQGSVKLSPYYDEYGGRYTYLVVPMVEYPDGTRLLLEEAGSGFDFSVIYDFVESWENWIDSVAPQAPEQD